MSRPSRTRASIFALGSTLLVVLVCAVFALLWLWTHSQTLQDVRRLEAAGFTVQDLAEERQESPAWILHLEKAFFDEKACLHLTWLSYGSEEGRSNLSADELAEIVARHRGLRHISLNEHEINQRLLDEIGNLPKLQSVYLESNDTWDTKWLDKIESRGQLVQFDLQLPDISPAVARRMLHSFPDLDQVGLPEWAIDDAICDQILNRPAITWLSIYFAEGQPHSAAAIRLAENFSGDMMTCVGPGKESDAANWQPLHIVGAKSKRPNFCKLPSLHLEQPEPSTGMTYIWNMGSVRLTNYAGRVHHLLF